MIDQPPHPIRLVVTDDLRRSRLTVFFRLLLGIPHFLWAFLLLVAVAVAVFVQWWILLFRGRPAEGLRDFTAGFIRYSTHIEAYVLLAANPFPGFYPMSTAPYPVDLEIDPPGPQSRWKTFFRLFLAIPAFAISSDLLFGGPRSGNYLAGGVGTQQGLLVYVFDRAGSGIAGTLLLSFSVGVYVATTILNVVLGFGAIFLMLGTLRWRRVVVPEEEKAYARGP